MPCSKSCFKKRKGKGTTKSECAHFNIHVLANAYYGLSLYAGVDMTNGRAKQRRGLSIATARRWKYIDENDQLTEVGLIYLKYCSDNHLRVRARKSEAKRRVKK